MNRPITLINTLPKSIPSYSNDARPVCEGMCFTVVGKQNFIMALSKGLSKCALDTPLHTVDPCAENTSIHTQDSRPFRHRMSFPIVSNQVCSGMVTNGALKIIGNIKRFVFSSLHSFMWTFTHDAFSKVAVHTKNLKALGISILMNPVENIGVLILHSAAMFSAVVLNMIKTQKLKSVLSTTGTPKSFVGIMEQSAKSYLAVILQAFAFTTFGMFLSPFSRTRLGTFFADISIKKASIFVGAINIELRKSFDLITRFTLFSIHDKYYIIDLSICKGV